MYTEVSFKCGTVSAVTEQGDYTVDAIFDTAAAHKHS